MKRLLLGTLFVLCHLATANAGEVTVAVIGPMTGRLAEFGAQIRAGAELAVGGINAGGGVNGNRVRLIIEDDGCEPAKAVAAAASVAAKHVALVVGHFCARASIPAAQLYAKAGIVQIAPASTNPKLTKDRAGRSIFRLSGRDDQQAMLAADYLAKKSSYGKIVILHDNTVFGRDLANGTLQALRAAGRSSASFGALDANVMSSISRMKLMGTEVVYFGGNYKDAARLLRELRKQGMETKLVGSDALATQEFWKATGIAGNGTAMTHLWDPRTSPSAKAAVAKFRARRIEPEGYVLYAHAAVEAWAQAASAAGSTKAKAVSEKLNTMTFATVLGSFGFDKKGDPTRSFYKMYRWAAGRYQLID